MQALYETGEPLEKEAIALALVATASDEGDEILKTNPELARKAEAGEITWSEIARKAY